MDATERPNKRANLRRSSSEHPNRLTKATLQRLPKAELHRHLDGSARITSIIDLAKEQGVKLPTFDPKELAKLVCVDMKCTSLEEYLRGFAITLKVLQKPYALTRVMYEVCEDAVADGVRYLEVRFSPILHVQEGLSLSSVMEAVIQGQIMAEYNLKITVRIIVCGMRQLPASVTKDLAEIAWRYRHKGVAGFDLAGPEDGFSSKHHKDAFDIVRGKCVNCTLHSGEGAGPESIQDSIRYCGAHRLGHGTRLGEDETLMKYVIDRRIALEVCLTSNVQTKAVSSLEAHPVRKYFDAGVIVVPCCDNTTVSSVTLSGEYDILQKIHNFTVEEIVTLIDYGFSSAFVTVSQKQRFRAEVLKNCVDILREEGYDISGILNNHYFDDIGVDFSALVVSNPTKLLSSPRPKSLTLEEIRALPKTDLHCRFDGAVSIPTIWEEVKLSKTDLFEKCGVKIHTFDEFQVFIQNPEYHEPAKQVMKSMLQTEAQLVRGVDDVMKHAVADGVRYMELVIRPKTHIKQGLTQSQVIEIVYKAIEKAETDYKIKAQLILYVSTNADDPIDFRETAELAVKYRNRGVCGFGVFGDNDISTTGFKYFKSTFNYLKSENFNVIIACGKEEVGTITNALHDGGASRVSGAFVVHKFPRLMNHLAIHKIPIELNLTQKLRKLTSEIHTFAEPIRLFLDNGLLVTLCSFRFKMFIAIDNLWIDLLGAKEFTTLLKREKGFAEFRSITLKYLQERGFNQFYTQHYFSPNSRVNMN